jgi:hypothetical protein
MTFSFVLGVLQSAATAVGASTMRGATAPKDVPVA